MVKSSNGGSVLSVRMVTLRKNGILRQLFRIPIYIYRCHLHRIFGKRLLLLTHTGRRTGLRRQTALEVVEYRGDVPEVVVANGFGPDSDWLRNIQTKSDEEVTVGSQHFVACHRFLGEDEAVRVIERYEHRNRFIAPIVRAGFTWLLGWKYRANETDRRRLVSQIPLLAFRRRS
jgi:deazaflavin-dependent oxidoreductase (nitroreductase family)